MNIRYIGSKENPNQRLACIEYNKKEERKIDFLTELLEIYNFKFFGEEEALCIEVSDKDDYNYVKEVYLKFKKYNFLDDLSKAVKHLLPSCDYEFVYEECETDFEMLSFLCERGFNIMEIKNIMRKVSGADDAYYNALDMFSQRIM